MKSVHSHRYKLVLLNYIVLALIRALHFMEQT